MGEQGPSAGNGSKSSSAVCALGNSAKHSRHHSEGASAPACVLGSVEEPFVVNMQMIDEVPFSWSDFVKECVAGEESWTLREDIVDDIQAML